MKAAYQSSFSFNVTQPYPYPWFTWVAVVGGIIATVLLSLVNFAANGYYLETYYTSNPNDTTQPWWFDKAPMTWFSKLTTTCEPQQLTVDQSYLTTNLGMSYTVLNITQSDPGGNGSRSLASVPYLNTTLKSCKVMKLAIHTSGSSYGDIGDWLSWEASEASALASCIVTGTEGDVNVTLLTTLPPHNDILRQPCFNMDSQPSLYWGCNMTGRYYGDIGNAIAIASRGLVATDDNPYPSWVRGQIPLSRNGTDDITSLDFFNCGNWYFVAASGSLSYAQTWDQVTIKDWLHSNQSPNISLTVDAFGKSYYSTILTDLGQPNNSNALADPRLVEYLYGYNESIYTSPSTASIAGMEPFEIKPATFFMKYACSTPVRKDAGSLFIAILVADIVLLQALWKLFNWVTFWWMCRRHPEANVCAGCRNLASNTSYEPLRGVAHGLVGESKNVSSLSSVGISLFDKPVSSR